RSLPMSPLDEFSAALQRYRPYLEEANYARLLEESDQIAPSAIRLNLLKANTSPLPLSRAEGSINRLQYLSRKYGWLTKPLPFSVDSMQILESGTSPSQTLEFQLGQYYLQDAASIL